MALPADIKSRMRKGGDVKVSMKEREEHAVIEGKTAVPFGSFMKLVQSRKVQPLMKRWQNEPVVISSDLLTHIASAGSESQEDRSKIILTAIVLGLAFGIFLATMGLFLLNLFGMSLGQRELITGLGILLILGVAVYSAMRVQGSGFRQDLIEKIEKIANVFGK
jgi:hypothetical protein